MLGDRPTMYTRQRWRTRSAARSEGSFLLGERAERHKGQPVAAHPEHREAPQQGETNFSTVQIRLHTAHDVLISVTTTVLICTL